MGDLVDPFQELLIRQRFIDADDGGLLGVFLGPKFQGFDVIVIENGIFGLVKDVHLRFCLFIEQDDLGELLLLDEAAKHHLIEASEILHRLR